MNHKYYLLFLLIMISIGYAEAACVTPINNSATWWVNSSNGICAGTYKNITLKMNNSNYDLNCNGAVFIGISGSAWDDNTRSSINMSNCNFYNYTAGVDIYNKWKLDNVTWWSDGNITIWANGTILNSNIKFLMTRDKGNKISYSSYVAGQSNYFEVQNSIITTNDSNKGFVILVQDRSVVNKLFMNNNIISNYGNGTDDAVRMCEANTLCRITNNQFSNCRGLSLNGFSDGTYYRSGSLINVSGNTFTNCFEPIKLTRYNNATGNNHTIEVNNNIINCSLSGRNVDRGQDMTHDCVGVNMDDVANVVVNNNTVYQYNNGYALDAGSSDQDGTTLIANVTFSNNRVYGLSSQNEFYYMAIAINQSYNNYIIDNLFTGWLCNLSVISLGDTYNTTVLRNTVNITGIGTNCLSAGYGINVYKLYGGAYYGLNVSNNYISGVNAGIRLGSADATKAKNYFLNNTLVNILKYDYYSLTDNSANNSDIEYYRNNNRVSFFNQGVYIINGSNNDFNINSTLTVANISVYPYNGSNGTYTNKGTNFNLNILGLVSPYNDLKNLTNGFQWNNQAGFSTVMTANQRIALGDYTPCTSWVNGSLLNYDSESTNYCEVNITIADSDNSMVIVVESPVRINFSQLRQWYPYNDVYNVSTLSVLYGNIDNQSILLSVGQQIIVGNYSSLSFVSVYPSGNVNQGLLSSSLNVTDPDGVFGNITLSWYSGSKVLLSSTVCFSTYCNSSYTFSDGGVRYSRFIIKTNMSETYDSGYLSFSVNNQVNTAPECNSAVASMIVSFAELPNWFSLFMILLAMGAVLGIVVFVAKGQVEFDLSVLLAALSPLVIGGIIIVIAIIIVSSIC